MNSIQFVFNFFYKNLKLETYFATETLGAKNSSNMATTNEKGNGNYWNNQFTNDQTLYVCRSVCV